MDPRIAIIRFYALCLAALACAVLWPEVGVGLWPVAFFFPGCPCCGGMTCGSFCSDTIATEVTVEISGMTGSQGACDCTTLDGTYVLTSALAPPLTGECGWGFDVSPDFCDGDAQEIAFLYATVVSNRIMVFYHSPPSGTALRWRSALYSPPVECATLGTVSLAVFSDDHFFCSNAGSTCDITL